MDAAERRATRTAARRAKEREAKRAFLRGLAPCPPALAAEPVWPPQFFPPAAGWTAEDLRWPARTKPGC